MMMNPFHVRPGLVPLRPNTRGVLVHQASLCHTFYNLRLLGSHIFKQSQFLIFNYRKITVSRSHANSTRVAGILG